MFFFCGAILHGGVNKRLDEQFHKMLDDNKELNTHLLLSKLKARTLQLK